MAAKRNDFLEGFLKGLYQSGVGNPEVQRENQKLVEDRNIALTKTMAENGMTPNKLPPDHPIAQKVGGFISSLFGGASTPSLSASSFTPDPEGIYQNPNGDVVSGKTNALPGAKVMPRTPGTADLFRQAMKDKQEADKNKPTATIVYGKDGRPRLEALGYTSQPGELAQPTDLSKGLSTLGQFTANEQRGTFFGAKGNQIGAQMADQFSKDIDPSELPPTSVIGRAAQSVKRTVNALTLMKPGSTVTKADFEAAKGDLDTIVSQASATVEGRKMLNTENIMGKVKDIQSYISLHPNDVTVPENIVSIYRNIVNDVGPIAQETVQSHIDRKFQLMKKHYRNTMTPEEMDAYTQKTKDAYDIKKLMGDSSTAATPTGTATHRWNPQTGQVEVINAQR